MTERESPNDALTPTFIGEQLVYVPLLVFYSGALAIKKYIEEQQNEIETPHT